MKTAFITFASMLQQTISFADFGFSSKLIQDLISKDNNIAPLVESFFGIDSVIEAAKKKDFDSEKRSILIEVLKRQNAAIRLSNKSSENLKSLEEASTFTITTGHQLNLFSGPLYSIYKVAQTIVLTQQLNHKDSKHNYVPVFWMATEDHDFEEINHIHLFNDTLNWEHQDQLNKVSGRMATKGIDTFIAAVKSKFSNAEDHDQLNPFFETLANAENLAQATRNLMNYLFGEFGLIIIDGDDAQLKQSFKPVAYEELRHQLVLGAVSKTNAYLRLNHYHEQVFLRNCNLFMIQDNGVRERISLENNEWKIGDTATTVEELLSELDNNPAKFSPNALLRPVYQECVLPNLVYVGGGGEIAYWLQIKGVFDALELDYPLLCVRDSFLLLRQKDFEILTENKLAIADLKGDLNEFFKLRVKEEVGGSLILAEIESKLNQLKEDTLIIAKEIDNGAEQSVESTFSRVLNDFQKLEDKLIKAKKNKDENLINKVSKLKSKIYPDGGFQERYDNIISYLVNDPAFVQKVMRWYSNLDQTKINVIQYP